MKKVTRLATGLLGALLGLPAVAASPIPPTSPTLPTPRAAVAPPVAVVSTAQLASAAPVARVGSQAAPATRTAAAGGPEVTRTVEDRWTVSFSSPDAPRRVEATLYWGVLRVRGHDGADVWIEPLASGEGAASRLVRREDAGFVVSERSNVVQIVADPPERSGVRDLRLLVRVPRETDLVLRMDRGGEIEVEDVTGELEVSSNNGSVVLSNVGGQATVDALNGSIAATFREVEPDRAMSFSTLNGEIDVSFPASTRANLRVRTRGDDIETDFDLVPLDPAGVAQGTVDTGDSGPSEEAKGRSLSARQKRALSRLDAAMNGGGPLFFFSTHNGVVRIRRSSP